MVHFSILKRISLNVGKPTAAVIFLTCLFLPSLSIIFTQVVGIFFRKRMGGFLSGTGGAVLKEIALHFFVRYNFPSTVISTPFCRSCNASSVISPSTCTQYSLVCSKPGFNNSWLSFLSLVRIYATRVIALKDGKLVYEGDPKNIDQAWFEKIYGEGAKEVHIN